MGIFGINYDKPGPGINKNEPPKKGFKRFFEIIRRDFANLVKLNLVLLMFLAPSLTIFIYNYLKVGNVLLLLLSIVLAFPTGGAITSSLYCISTILMDEPRLVMYDFWRKFKENFVQSVFFGILYVAFLYLQIYTWTGMVQGYFPTSYVTMIMLAIAFVFVEMVAPYIFLQIGHLELKNKHILKNGVVIALKYLLKSFSGMILSLIPWFITFIFYPLSLWWMPILLFVGFSLSFLIILLRTWAPVDELFSISKTIRERREQDLDEVIPLFSSHPKVT